MAEASEEKVLTASEQAIADQVHEHLGIKSEATKAMDWAKHIVARVLEKFSGKRGKPDPEDVKAAAQAEYEAKSVEDHGDLSPFAKKST